MGHPTTMPGRVSIQSRTLANVRLQLRTGKTRGSNPRPLSSEEVRALEARRDQLQTEMANRQRQRIVSRVNTHSSQEAERTREVIITELQPLTALVAGSEADSREERIKARNNQIALLQAANREDREAMRKERVATREANAKAKAVARKAGDKRRKTSAASGSTCAPTSPAHSYASDWTPSAEVDNEQEHDPASEAANDMSPAEQRAELEEYLSRGVHAKVNCLMADIDARRGCK